MDICDITCFQQTAQHSLQTNEPHLNPIELTLCYFSSFSPGVYIDLPFLALLFLTTRRQHLASFLWPFHDVPWPPAFSSKRTAGRFFHNFMWTLLIFSLWRWHHRFICIHLSFIYIYMHHFSCYLRHTLWKVNKKSFIYSQPLGANLPTQGMTLFEDVHHLSFLMDDLELHGFWVLLLQFICGFLCSFGTTQKATLIPPKRVALMIFQKTLPAATKPEFIKTFFIVSSAFARVRRKLILLSFDNAWTNFHEAFKQDLYVCKA